MISCTITKGINNEPADGFIEGTTRFVCVPEIEHAQLSTLVETPCFMQVRIDGEEVFSRELSPQLHRFALRDIVSRQPQTTSRSKLWSPRRSDQQPAQEFSVVFRSGGQSGAVLGTYEFHLLTCNSFEDRFNRHLHCHDGSCRCLPEFFTTDARAAETAVNCWNCGSPVKDGDVCKNCGCDQDRY